MFADAFQVCHSFPFVKKPTLNKDDMISSSSDSLQLSGILESFDLHQQNDFPANIQGHFLDLLIYSWGCNVFFVLTSNLISGPFSVVAALQIPSKYSRTIPQTIKYQNLQSINIEAFNNSELIRYSKTNATGLAQQYDSFLHTLTNLHALLVTKNLSPKPSNPWMTPAILDSKQHIESVWRQNATTLNRSILTRQKILCNRQMSKA